MTFRLRIEFAKIGRLAYLSHLEVVRAVERNIRRAGLPYHTSQGFNRHMRHAFGPALPVGTAGLHEFLDVWLKSYVPPDKALLALQQASSKELPILGLCYISQSLPSLQMSHTLHDYNIKLAYVEKNDAINEDIALETFFATLKATADAGILELLKKGKPKTYDLNKLLIGYKLEDLRQINSQNEEQIVAQLNLTLHTSEEGSLRPEQLLAKPLDDACCLRVLSIVRVGMREDNDS
ncbi:MAG: TIGR03936 family radical SAM-associated protein [Coriobacteriales bacterium]|jgi:radical SAM-linked protein|nr:TIGR03936 family radical SAM-associated protein [Coriobacteriales bacterium]